MALKFAVTDLAGNQVAVLTEYSDALVTIPYNDSRTAEVTMSPYSPAGLALGAEQDGDGVALRLMLKGWYIWPDGSAHLVFWGPILTPTWSERSGSAATLRLEAHDMSIRLKNHYLSGADTAIFETDPGLVPVSGDGLRMLRDAGKNAAAENLAGVPDLGIDNGTDTHPGAFAKTELTVVFHSGDATMHVVSTVGFPDSGTAPDDTLYIGTTALDYTGKTATSFTGVSGYAGADLPIGTAAFYNTPRALNVHKGDNVWQRWTEIAQDPFGPDFRLRPDDETPGTYALLDTMDKRETEGGTRDKRLSLIFQSGFGADNVESFTHAPQGASVRNRAVAVQAHSEPALPDKVAIQTNLASRIKYGNYVSWEAVGDSEENTGGSPTIKAKAQAVLLAYSEPPPDFSFQPRSDEAQRFIYGRDFEEGVVIACAAHFGGLRVWLPGFINEVRLRQVSAIGRTQTEIDALPEIVSATDVGDE